MGEAEDCRCATASGGSQGGNAVAAEPWRPWQNRRGGEPRQQKWPAIFDSLNKWPAILDLRQGAQSEGIWASECNDDGPIYDLSARLASRAGMWT